MVACSGNLDRATGVNLASDVRQVRIRVTTGNGDSPIETPKGLAALETGYAKGPKPMTFFYEGCTRPY
jgi:hypothetical protein